ncbi:MAG: hypothetical protein LQ341_006087 [Variospora aurantia]|nr:MAG: hypothetical protein LQ341_006087 [Variospora aurantia]
MMAATPIPIEPGSSNTSSAGLSSPPSPRSPTTHTPVTYPTLPSQLLNGGGDGRLGETVSPAAKDSAPKPRKPRKKKEPVDGNIDNKSSTLPNGEKAPPKVRKPRAPKGTSAAAIKKEQQKLAFAHAAESAKPHAIAPNQPPDRAGSAHPLHLSGVHLASPRLPIGKIDEAIPNSHPPTQYVMPTPPRPPSGQNYDPIRSATIEPRTTYQQQQPLPQPPIHARTSASTPPRPATHASISPSIASLLESRSAAPTYPNAVLKRENDGPVTSPPETKRPRLTPPPNIVETPQVAFHHPQIPVPPPSFSSNNNLSAIDGSNDQTAAKAGGRPPAGSKKPSSQSSSSHSPKPSGRKDTALPPLPPGNGLLSSAMLGGGYDSKGPGRTAPTVILHVPLNGDTNKYVNFARLAEEQYGFDALHPRLAAQRERLARVAAAGAAIENFHKTGSARSADEMSVDLSDGEPEADNSNIEMGGISGNKDPKQSEAEGSEQPGVKHRKKRTMKEDMYDKEDDFIDDTELAFEEQAAATKDGFFVYSGPLIPQGEKANVERADGGTPTRGRGGRGRGRGSRGGASGGTTRGGGGGGATAADGSTKLTKSGQPRKSRMTKAAREAMDKEKVARESMAPLAAKPTNYPG